MFVLTSIREDKELLFYTNYGAQSVSEILAIKVSIFTANVTFESFTTAEFQEKLYFYGYINVYYALRRCDRFCFL